MDNLHSQLLLNLLVISWIQHIGSEMTEYVHANVEYSCEL